MTQPFPIVELALKAVIEDKYPAAKDHTGGDLSYEAGQDLYVFVGMVPGSGRTDEINGEWAIDVDVFGDSYIAAMNHALALEAILVSGRHRSQDLILDNVEQNVAPSERPWNDDAVFRIGATYVFTARRSG